MFRNVQILYKKLVTNEIPRRCLCKTQTLRKPGAYDGEGKTTVNILNMETDLGLMINGFSQVGFRLNNDITVLGPMVIFPRSVLSWKVASISDINEESLSLFAVLEPKVDLVVLGIGDKQKNLDFYRQLVPFMHKKKLSFEVLPTEQACATFNFLNAEGRNVAGAMIPPTIIETDMDDIMKSKMRYQNLYESDNFLLKVY